MTEATRRKSRPILACLTSGKGGVGKTSLSVNLAFALAQRGLRVLLVDGDLGLANVDVLLGLQVRTTIRDILDREDDPLSAVVYVEPNLGVLPASSGVPDMVNLGPEEQEQLGRVVRAMARSFDFVLVDTAAGIGPAVLWFNTLVDYNILVVTPDPTAITDAYALIKVLSRDYHRRKFHLLLNSVASDKEGRQVYEHLARVASQFLHLQLQYLGMVPRDAAVSRGVREQAPFLKLVPQSKASQAVTALAARLHAWLTSSSATPKPVQSAGKR
jgi:flagellar biosynthesis protein FlhG